MSETNNKPYKLYVKLSSDYYHAFLTVDADDYNFRLTKEEVVKALADKKVSFGIDPNAIDFIVNNPEEAQNIEVATGIEHEHGEDAQIIYEINMKNDFKAVENEDGTVDFKNTNFVQTVTKDQVLAYKTPATEGKTGTTVTGMAIKAKDGKLGNFKFGKNVVQSEDGMQIMAACNGTIKIDGTKITVIEVLEIFTDVGVRTGNIAFSGRIIIRGNVTSGYKVETPDSIEIYGVVESAEISAGGEIIISGGVQGNDDCLIKAGGDIKSNYFNNCQVIAGGEIITDSMMHCDVMCDQSITAKGKKGLILGGQYVARHHITAKTIGTEIGTITKLQLGITNEIMTEFQELAEHIKDYKNNISKLRKAYDILSKQRNVKVDDPKINDMYMSTKMSLDDYNNKLKAAMIDFKNINDLIEKLRDVYVKADAVFPGVRVKIGSSHYSVKTAVLGVKLIKDQGEIVLTSY